MTHRNPQSVALCAAFVAAIPFALAACGSKSEAPPPVTAANEPNKEPQKDTSKFTEAEIIEVVDTINMDEVNESKIVPAQTSNLEVIQFAKRLETDHMTAHEQAKQLQAKLGITPRDSELSNKMKGQAEETRRDLKGKMGSDFDKAYVEHEIKDHEEALKVIDKDLLPNCHDPQVRAYLEQFRQHIAHHLGEAQAAKAKK